MGLECMGYRGWWGRLELQLTETHVCPAEAPSWYLPTLGVGLRDQQVG